MLFRMAAIMTLPMAAWMRWRGHGRRPCVEMTAAMVVPALAVIALYEASAVQDVDLLMGIEHVAMFVAMFAAMAARPEEYSEVHGVAGDRAGHAVAAAASPAELGADDRDHLDAGLA